MAQQLIFGVNLGTGKAGATLRAQLYNPDGTTNGSEISTGFTEIGNGVWVLNANAIPDDFSNGAITVYESGSPATPLAISSINPANFTTDTNLGAIEFTYTVTRSDNSDPIAGVVSYITTDTDGTNVVFTGVTDAFGVLRNEATQEKPFLQAGTYYVWNVKAGYSFTNPDTEVVS